MLRRVTFNLFFHHLADVFDPDERRAEAERLLRMQVEEWANEGHSHELNESFHYAANADFDPHP